MNSNNDKLEKVQEIIGESSAETRGQVEGNGSSSSFKGTSRDGTAGVPKGRASHDLLSSQLADGAVAAQTDNQSPKVKAPTNSDTVVNKSSATKTTSPASKTRDISDILNSISKKFMAESCGPIDGCLLYTSDAADE